jgi:hypothetical protein
MITPDLLGYLFDITGTECAQCLLCEKVYLQRHGYPDAAPPAEVICPEKVFCGMELTEVGNLTMAYNLSRGREAEDIQYVYWSV